MEDKTNTPIRTTRSSSLSPPVSSSSSSSSSSELSSKKKQVNNNNNNNNNDSNDYNNDDNLTKLGDICSNDGMIDDNHGNNEHGGMIIDDNYNESGNNNSNNDNNNKYNNNDDSSNTMNIDNATTISNDTNNIENTNSVNDYNDTSILQTCTSMKVNYDNNNNDDSENLLPLPRITQKQLNKKFIIEEGIEVTSMDISPHGGHVVVGCGNGYILLYDMSRPNQPPLHAGHILAKGLHTNLLLTVKISEDCRFCFGGVIRGSSEMIAIDMGKLPVWSNSKKKYGSELLSIYNHHDPKLRGFGAAVRVDSKICSMPTYRLVCGKGIKNVHIWQFLPPRVGDVNSKPEWTCIYDVASNGNTIECMGFRNGGNEVLSKSAGVNLRIWNLNDVDAKGKLSFEDISNTQDIRTPFEGYAFGGTYDLSLVRLDAPKLTNRDAFELPILSSEDDQGQRRKRSCRQIDEVIGTSDAKHILVLTTDGGVFYKNGENNTALKEFGKLKSDRDRDMVWAVKRVGESGEVVLMRAIRTEKITLQGDKASQVIVPLIASLSDLNNNATNTSVVLEISSLVDATSNEVQGTVVDEGVAWHNFGYYHVECDYESNDNYEPEVSSSDVSVSKSVTSKRKEDAKGKKENKENIDQNLSGASKNKTDKKSQNGRPPLHPMSKNSSSDSLHKPTSRNGGGASRSGTPSGLGSRHVGLTTPEIAQALESGISPQEMAAKAAKVDKLDGGPEKRRRVMTGSMSASVAFAGISSPQVISDSSRVDSIVNQMLLLTSEKKEYKPLEIGERSTAIRTVDQSSLRSSIYRTVPSAVPLPFISEYRKSHDDIIRSWLQMSKALRSDSSTNPDSILNDNVFYKLYQSRSYRDIVDSVPPQVRFSGSRTEVSLYRYRIEQDRIFSQFIQEVAKVSASVVTSISVKLNQVYHSDEYQQQFVDIQNNYKDRRLVQLVAKYKKLVQNIIKEQYIRLQGDIAGDKIEIGLNIPIDTLSVRFKHAGMLMAAEGLCSQVDLLTKGVIDQLTSHI